MRSKWFGVFALLIAVFAVGTTGLAVAKKKPKPVKTSVTVSATLSQSTGRDTYTGTVSSPKAVCEKHRKVIFQQKQIGKDLVNLASTRTDSKGAWTIPNQELVASLGSFTYVTVNPKKVGSKLCKQVTTFVNKSTPGP
jgi:ribosomal protein S19